MSWIWALTLMKHIVFYEGSNSLVVNETLKFISHYNPRILCTLDEPSHKDFAPTYAYIEELETLLELLNILFRVFKNLSYPSRQYL